MEKIWCKSYPQEILYELPDTKIPLFNLIENFSKPYSGNTALIFYGTKITYADLFIQINNFSASLSIHGVKKGDRVAIFLPNCPQSIIAYFAILKLGAVVVQINPLLVERELVHQIKDSGARILIYLELFSKKVKNALPFIDIDTLISAGIGDYLTGRYKFLYAVKSLISLFKPSPLSGSIKFIDLVLSVVEPPDVSIDPIEDIALIQYTGGTTGVSKGVMLTHYNLVSNVLQARSWFSQVKPGEEVFLSVLPFFHAFGMTVCMNLSLIVGAANVILPKFSASETLRSIQKNTVTVFPGVPAIFYAINSHPNVQKYNLSTIKFCISGAAPLPASVKSAFENLSGGRLVEGFGLTEASPITHCNPIFGESRKNSIGLPLPGTNCKIVDIHNKSKECGVGEIGELAISGPQVMKGYWGGNEDDKEIIIDGWLYTGDIAKVDMDGYFYIVDRKKDMIISGGFNVYPKEVEEVLGKNQKVLESAVVGIFDKFLGEYVKAFVVIKRGYMASETEIIEFCKANLAKYKVPKEVEFVDDLPKNMLGKVLRRKMRTKNDFVS